MKRPTLTLPYEFAGLLILGAIVLAILAVGFVLGRVTA